MRSISYEFARLQKLWDELKNVEDNEIESSNLQNVILDI